jgi:hypothetical protein
MAAATEEDDRLQEADARRRASRGTAPMMVRRGCRRAAALLMLQGEIHVEASARPALRRAGDVSKESTGSS